MKQFGKTVHYWEPEEASDRPGIVYLRGEKRSLLFDAGNSRRHAQMILDDLAANGLPYPDYTLISHMHADHWFGLVALSSTSFASARTIAATREAAGKSWDRASIEARIKAGEDYPELLASLDLEYFDHNEAIRLAVPEIGISDCADFDLGGVHCRFKFVGGDHADDSSVLYITEEKLLLLGDILYIQDNDAASLGKLRFILDDFDAAYYMDSHRNKIFTRDEVARALEAR